MTYNKKATRVWREKETTPSGLVREVNIWDVSANANYPDGIKYRLVLADPVARKVIALFDNHSPKGHHFHHDGIEMTYPFVTLKDLLIVFFELCAQIERERQK